MKKLIFSLLALSLLISPAHAQETKAQLNTDVSTNFQDNTTGAITPAILRTVVNNMIASWQQAPRVNPQVGTTYNFVVGDYGQLVTFSNSNPVAVTLPQATSTGSFATWNAFACNKGTGAVTITPATSTIGGSSTLVLQQNQCQAIVSDGTNYQIGGSTVTLGMGVGVTNISGGTTSQVLYDNNHILGELPLSGTGSVCMSTNCVMTTPTLGVATASTINSLTITPSTGTLTIASGKTLTFSNTATFTATDGKTYALPVPATTSTSTIPQIVASGATALATSAIGSGSCNTTTASASGVLTTDVVSAGFNGSVSGVTGYTAATSGALSIRPYPTANNVNFEVCNSTLASITPGAVTLNWHVTR